MLEAIPPEIMRCPLDKCVLLGKSVFPDKTPAKFLEEACAKPKSDDIRQAVKALKEIGALEIKKKGKVSVDDGNLTHLGTLMNRLPLQVRNLLYFQSVSYRLFK